MNALAEVRRIVDELETPDQRCEATRRLQSCDELLELAHYYNWDDGLEVPRSIMDHPICDLGLALHLFELAEGIVWLTSEDSWEYQQGWARFCEELASRIQNGRYPTVTIPFESRLTTVQQFKAKKDGVADVFVTSIRPDQKGSKIFSAENATVLCDCVSST